VTGNLNNPDPTDAYDNHETDVGGAERPAPDHPIGRAEAANPGTPPQAPPGGRLLSVDEAIEALVTGDHTASATGSLPLDGALIDLLRDGSIIACRTADGRLAFTRTAPPTAPTA
jgi:hypothetical protein